jgi:hypothetical protein
MFPRTFFFAIGFGVLIVMRGMLTLGRLLARLTHAARPSPNCRVPCCACC